MSFVNFCFFNFVTLASLDPFNSSGAQVLWNIVCASITIFRWNCGLCHSLYLRLCASNNCWIPYLAPTTFPICDSSFMTNDAQCLVLWSCYFCNEYFAFCKVRCDKRILMLLWLQVVANLILILGVNIAGIFVYDRRDQIRRKLFGFIRASASANLRIQDERSKLVLNMIYAFTIVV